MFPRSPHLLLLPATLLALPHLFRADSSTFDPLAAKLEFGRSFETQQYSTGNGKYLLRGTVVNSVTSEPIKGALVQIYSNGQTSLLTGPDGKFQFDDLPFSQIYINVRKPGFFSENELQSATQRMVTMGPDTPSQVLKLVPEGVIHGRISEENGEPIDGLPVALLQEIMQNGRKTWQQRSGAQTDEDGTFRIAELQPGNYFLSAGPGRDNITFPLQAPQKGAQGIPAVYFPGGSDLSSSAPISVTPGKKIEINLSISPQPLYRVSGTISGYAPTQSVNLQLRNSAGMYLPYNPRFDATTGTFRIPGLPAGSYTLLADAPKQQPHMSSLTAAVSLTVNAEISGIHLILLPTVNIPIRMEVVWSLPDTKRIWPGEAFFPAYVRLVSHHGNMFETRYDMQRVGERVPWSFELQNIAPGTYTVEITPNGPLYVQSATSGITNLLESELSVAPGSSPQPIEITFRDDVATLRGTVSLDNQPLSATILAISENASVPVRVQPTDMNGGFELPFLAPGSYKILAVDHAEHIEYANPEALRKYSSNVREVTLSPDQTAKINLELTKVGE